MLPFRAASVPMPSTFGETLNLADLLRRHRASLRWAVIWALQLRPPRGALRAAQRLLAFRGVCFLSTVKGSLLFGQNGALLRRCGA